LMPGSVANDRKLAHTPCRGPLRIAVFCVLPSAKRAMMFSVASVEPSSETIRLQFVCVCSAIECSCSVRNAAPSLVHIRMATCAASKSACGVGIGTSLLAAMDPLSRRDRAALGGID
jgi:hypothetical protein